MRGHRSCLAAAAVLMLAGCAGVANPFAVAAPEQSPPPRPAATEQTGPAPAQTPEPAAPHAAPRAAPRAAPHAVPGIDVPREVSRAVARAALPPTPPVPLTGLGARIRGMEKTAIARLLGEPSFIRRDDPAEIWQYRGERCILDIFMYKDGKSFAAAHVALRSRTVERPADEKCYADIFARRKAG